MKLLMMIIIGCLIFDINTASASYFDLAFEKYTNSEAAKYEDFPVSTEGENCIWYGVGSDTPSTIKIVRGEDSHADPLLGAKYIKMSHFAGGTGWGGRDYADQFLQTPSDFIVGCHKSMEKCRKNYTSFRIHREENIMYFLVKKLGEKNKFIMDSAGYCEL